MWCRHTSMRFSTSWKHGWLSIHDPRGCSINHHVWRLAAIIITIKVRQQRTLPSRADLNFSSPNGLLTDRLEVPLDLGSWHIGWATGGKIGWWIGGCRDIHVWQDWNCNFWIQQNCMKGGLEFRGFSWIHDSDWQAKPELEYLIC